MLVKVQQNRASFDECHLKTGLPYQLLPLLKGIEDPGLDISGAGTEVEDDKSCMVGGADEDWAKCLVI